MMSAAPSAEMQQILERLMVEDAALPDPTSLPAAQGRAVVEAINRRWNRNLPAMLRSDNLELKSADGRSTHCRLHVPHGFEHGLIVFVHGGGWAFCSKSTHERAARLLAAEAGVPVLAFDYRLAPEHPYPNGLEDCIAVWRAVSAGHPELAEFAGPTAIAGDSAGANLALAMMLHEIAEQRPRPDAGLLFYGVFGADLGTDSYRIFADGPGLTREKMRRYWAWYVEDAGKRNDPFVSPLCADDASLRQLPPLYLNAAAIDPLRSDTEMLVARLSALRRSDRFRLHEGVVHGFMQMSGELAEARTATAEAASAFRQLVGLSTHA